MVGQRSSVGYSYYLSRRQQVFLIIELHCVVPLTDFFSTVHVMLAVVFAVRISGWPWYGRCQYRKLTREISFSLSLSLYLSIYLSIFLSFYLSIYLSFYLSIYLSISLPLFQAHTSLPPFSLTLADN